MERLEDRTLPAVTLNPITTVLANFQGTNRAQSGSIPPDTMGAVGPNHVVELINGAFAVYDRAGTLQTRDSMDNFWDTAFTNAGTVATADDSFDPRILYDAFSNRWFAVAVDARRSANSRFLVGVTTGNDPAVANWRGFTIDAGTGTRWADFPTIGLDATGLYIAAIMFDVPGGADEAAVVTVVGIPKGSLTATSRR